MTDLPDAPFTRAQGLQAGVSRRALEGPRFRRLHRNVYCSATLTLTFEQEVEAARLALPGDARTTGITRIRQLGLDYGSSEPLHFVRAGDLHRQVRTVYLHRTVLMPPCDDTGVTPAAAFLDYCARARVIDAIKVGDWLLHHERMTVPEVTDLAQRQPWRAGASEAVWVLAHCHPGARSLKESELRAILVFAGLPVPGVNQPITPDDPDSYIVDLWYREQGVGVEYEGEHHQNDRQQYGIDIERYADFRRLDARYVQVTNEKLATPRRVVGQVFRELLARGYDGDPPRFDVTWPFLFRRVRDVPGIRRTRGRAA